MIVIEPFVGVLFVVGAVIFIVFAFYYGWARGFTAAISAERIRQTQERLARFNQDIDGVEF